MKRIIFWFLFVVFSLNVYSQGFGGGGSKSGFGKNGGGGSGVHNTGTGTTGGTTSDGAVVITGHPLDQNVNEGANTSFSVTATGSGLSYQWQYLNGSTWTNLTNAGVYSGVNTNTLLITIAPFIIDVNNYRVAVTGTKPPTILSNTAIINVNHPRELFGNLSINSYNIDVVIIDAIYGSRNIYCDDIIPVSVNGSPPIAAIIPTADNTILTCDNLIITTDAQ